ncbi:error-prone DNA polymerase, DnaE-like [Granulicella pectinivorans]|uniref:Error-prone DNA polymerase n=1 Tax=Granulicella pectinivorans TaxID=474950 RepID=A0A1I6MPP8_9BACT|nr:error-prone DNA polymerase [Granulicella pectinivorans]SFS17587.1 error-prone DNA polymerase, DnaE-like [Granulicella pectinivorans]
MTEYIELHASSAFSFLEGASQPEALIQAAVKMQMPAMALMDRNGFYGAPRFHTEAKDKGIRAHIGVEIAASGLGMRLQPPAWLPHQCKPEPVRLPLLCTSRVGYQNLCQMMTRFKMREATKSEGFATVQDLGEFAGGLICLTGGDEGPLASALARGGEEEGRKTVERLVSLFGHGNVYVELQRHGDRGQESRNQAALRIAESLRLPILATNGVRYATQYEREILDVLTSIRHGVSLDRAGRLLQANSQRQVRGAKAMGALFRDLPEAIENSVLLSQRLEFAMNDLGYEFPSYDVGENDSMDSFLGKRVMEGIVTRYLPKNDDDLMRRAKKQAEKELALIEKLGLAGYFLIVWDIVEYCKAHDILVQGRGSAANSVVCYALQITAIDPIGMDLLFERFLNENRKEWPDVDLDLPSGEKREQAIQYVYQRYGELGAAMTANVITYRGKSAAREVGKALGFDQDTLGRISGLVGNWEWRKKDETIGDNFRQAGFDVEHTRIAKYVELCERIQDLPRHLGQHSGGMVICQGQLNKVVPLERASMAGRTVLQWDKEDCNDLGLVKIDLLGLGMMAVMKDCLDLIPRHYGEAIDLAHLPQNDTEVYDTLCRADTVGMFQVESRAQMASIPRNAPRIFYDLVVQVAIIRPGPIVGKMMHPYMRRRQGKEAATCILPELEPVLRRTLGVPLFQEQLLRIAMVVGNFSGTEAEELRKAVGMRRSWKRMEELMVKLRAGMVVNQIAEETQEVIVQSIQSFALYGFPESHAASFALIAYASAYFKVKYLAAFTCAMLNNQPMGFYTPAVLVKDAQRHGLRVRPVDVQSSHTECTVEHEEDGSLSLRLGLLYARGLKRQTADMLVHIRRHTGAFKSVEDLALRVPTLNRSDLAQLARIGAMNALGEVAHRREAIWQVEQVSRPVGPLLRQHEAAPVSTRSPLRMMKTEERLMADYAGTGLTTGHHPMAYRRMELRRMGVLSAVELQREPDGRRVIAAGAIIARQRPGTALGFIFLSMEDETGIANIVIHPELYERDRVIVTRGKFLKVTGKLQNQDGVVHVKAERVERLEAVAIEVRSHDFH